MDMYKYETHMHTFPVSNCASSPPEEQVRAYKKKGYAGIIVTDHFINGNSRCPGEASWKDKMRFFFSGHEAAKKEGDACGLDVFFGFEYNIHGQEFLTYGITPEILLANPGMDRLTPEEYSAFVRDNGGYLAQAHPFRAAWWITNPGAADHRFMDGVEVKNSSMPDDVNAKALNFARRHGLAMQAGGDCHNAGSDVMGGVMLESKAGSIFDIIDAIRSNRVKLI
jgi:hypothetical protein